MYTDAKKVLAVRHQFTPRIFSFFDKGVQLSACAYMWDTGRKATIVNLIDAIEVTAAAETRQNSASTADSSTSTANDSEPDVSDDDGGDSQSIIKSGIIILGDDDDDDDDAHSIRIKDSDKFSKKSLLVAEKTVRIFNHNSTQTLSLIRMWSGFASEFITGAELLESMGLDNYPVVHIPDWVMTELGALVSNNDATVEEFKIALVYMLEMLTA